MSKKQKRILVDMACSVLHHGHIRILKKAYKFGKVIVALTSDKQILKYKKFKPKLNFKNRKEILLSIKYVSEVIKSNHIITNEFLKRNKIDLLVHGNDNKSEIDKSKIKIFKRTKNISSTLLRHKSNKKN